VAILKARYNLGRSRIKFTVALVACWLCTSIAPASGDDLSPEVLLTAKTMAVNRALFANISRYTCLESISRGDIEKRSHKLKKRDMVQVDVGIGDGQEIFSWPGASQFSSEDVADMIGHGLMENGLFGSFTASIFESDHALVKPAGEETINGRPAFHFTYTTSPLQERWDVNWLGARGSVGYDGEFWVDQSTLALVRLNVTAKDFPKNLPLQGMSITINYQPPVEKIVLPENALFTATELNGKTGYDSVLFSHCHVFQAESQVAGSPNDLKQVVGNYETARQILPSGLTMPITLGTSIDSKTAHIGDLIVGYLDKPVRISSSVTAPKGAKLMGRIREFDTLDDVANTFVVGLEFDQLDWPGHSYAFFADIVSMQPVHGVASSLADGWSKNAPMGPGGTITTSTTEMIWASKIPGAATFLFKNSPVLGKGFRMVWRTGTVDKK
jgi:hypothetical protein